MSRPEIDFDAQDQAEVYDETHIDDEGEGELSLDEAEDVLDVTQADGDADEEAFDEDDLDLERDLALDGVEGKPTAVPAWKPEDPDDQRLADYALKVMALSKDIEQAVASLRQA